MFQKDKRANLLWLSFALAGVLGKTISGRYRQHGRDRLQDQVALITGGSRGLGFLLARELGRQGCKVAICARDEDELTHAANDLRHEGIEVLTIICDVTDQAQVDRLIASTIEHFNRLNILVTDAGIIQTGPLPAMTLDDFRAAHNTMFWGPLYCIWAALPQMRRQGSGQIVTITSIGGKVSVPHLLPYSCAKFAAVGLSEGLRAELAREGITVTTIVPGLMRTGSHLRAYFKGDHPKEFAMFVSLATLPFISMDAERAAAQIVDAMKRGTSERILSIPARLLSYIHGLMPGLTSDMLGFVNRLLPSAPGPTPQESGLSVEQHSDPHLLHMLTTLGRSAARRFHEYPSHRPD